MIEEAVTAAAVRYEARWSYAALLRVDRDLIGRFGEQREMYWQAKRAGEPVEIEEQGAALVRAYDAITQAMEGEPQDAVVHGRAGDLRVAIGRGNAPATAVPDGVVYLSGDEVAQLLKDAPGFSDIAKIKSLFPGSVVAPADTLPEWTT